MHAFTSLTYKEHTIKLGSGNLLGMLPLFCRENISLDLFELLKKINMAPENIPERISKISLS